MRKILGKPILSKINSLGVRFPSKKMDKQKANHKKKGWVFFGKPGSERKILKTKGISLPDNLGFKINEIH